MSFTVAFPELEPRERYKLLCATVVPRPIALVTSVGRDGVVNAAPFSFFNVFSEEPPLIVLGLQHKPDAAPKDTTRNIAETGVFVVNLVDEGLAEAMNVCAIDFPPQISEIEAAAHYSDAIARWPGSSQARATSRPSARSSRSRQSSRKRVLSAGVFDRQRVINDRSLKSRCVATVAVRS